MKFKCRCSTISTITFASFNNKGCYCIECGGTKQLNLEFVKNEINKFDYEVLETEYTNAQTKLKLKCNKSHLIQISWNNFKNGKRCKQCYIEENWHKPEDRKFVQLCRSVLGNCLKKTKLKKNDRTEKLLGYSFKQFKDHLIAHFNWNNVKDKIWHVDHIFPIKAFLDYEIKDLKLINCLENLMPIEGKENLKKRAKYNKEKFKQWLAGKGVKCHQ
jgi:hypothetical protein